MPILDGSAKEFCEKIAQTGLVEQKAEKDFYIVKQKIEVRDEETGASIVVLPDDDLSIDVMVNFDSPVLANQYACLENVENFPEEVASSRTFVFVREIEPLVKGNLIKGGDLDNAVVIYDSPMPQEELDRLADLMGVQRKNVSEFGFTPGQAPDCGQRTRAPQTHGCYGRPRPDRTPAQRQSHSNTPRTLY